MLKIYNKLTLVFYNGILEHVKRKGIRYEIHHVKPLQELKFNLGKTELTLIDIRQIVSIFEKGVDIKIDGDCVYLYNVKLI
jgi:hypothetical protein